METFFFNCFSHPRTAGPTAEGEVLEGKENNGVDSEPWASQVVLVVKNPPANAGDIRDAGTIPGVGRSPGGVHGNPIQCSCLENPWTEEPGGLPSRGRKE